jgi:hypothetical protein
MSSAVSTPDLDRESLIARLESSQERVLKKLAGVTEPLSVFRPGEDRWSIREVLEHLVLCEYRFLERVKNAEPSTAAPDFEKDAAVYARGLDRTEKRQAPEQVIPSGKFASLGQAMAAFREARRQTIEYLREGSEDLRKLKAQGPLGDMDGYQILLLTALHTERHALQIDEIKNHPNYGK